MRNIFVYDSTYITGKCECGDDATFLLGITDKEEPHQMCAFCIAELSKNIIDALV